MNTTEHLLTCLGEEGSEIAKKRKVEKFMAYAKSVGALE